MLNELKVLKGLRTFTRLREFCAQGAQGAQGTQGTQDAQGAQSAHSGRSLSMLIIITSGDLAVRSG